MRHGVLRPLLITVCVAVAAISAGGCGAATCDDQGDESRLDVNFASVLAQQPQKPLTVRACVDGACRTVKYPGPQMSVPTVTFLGQGVVSGAQDLHVELTVADGEGHVIFHDETTVTPSKFQVNGEDCPPTTWHAFVKTDESGQLRAAPASGE